MPDAPQPTQQRAYTIVEMNADELAWIASMGLDASQYVVAQCPSVMPPQPSQPVQPVMIGDPVTGEAIGGGMVILVPIVVPILPPRVVQGVLGVNGAQAQTTMAGPPTADVRVLLPKQSLTKEAIAEHSVMAAARDGTARNRR